MNNIFIIRNYIILLCSMLLIEFDGWNTTKPYYVLLCVHIEGVS